ncbi:uncharacterized protein UDID_18742 [Ustilago sp. UG-2017a]|nr:uncharacterized protein UDID_18742 [Ustilago sp. UG-2017a]
MDRPSTVVIHTDNENVQYGLLKGSIRDPATQVLFREIFSLCLQHHIDLHIVAVHLKANTLADALSHRRRKGISKSPASFIADAKLSTRATFLLWNGLATSTRSRSTTLCIGYIRFASTTLRLTDPLPASTVALIKWAGQHHSTNKTYHLVKCNLAILNSWHIDLGLSTTSFDAAHLAWVLRGYKRAVGNPAPTAKLPITLPLLKQLVDALPLVCPSKRNRRMFQAAFCLAFACFLCSGELTWEELSIPVLTVGSVEFAHDGAFATIFLPSSKTDPFGTRVTLAAPSVPHKTCAVKALQVVCRGHPPSALLLALDDGRPFSRSSFLDTLSCCLTTCGISPQGYSGHSFQRGAATWAAANGVNDVTIQGLEHWRSDCFRRYVNKPAADRAATTAAALYTNADWPLDLSTPAWHDF